MKAICLVESFSSSSSPSSPSCYFPSSQSTFWWSGESRVAQSSYQVYLSQQLWIALGRHQTFPTAIPKSMWASATKVAKSSAMSALSRLICWTLLQLQRSTTAPTESQHSYSRRMVVQHSVANSKTIWRNDLTFATQIYFSQADADEIIHLWKEI